MFEARVDIKRAGITYRYPCNLPGPENMDIREVSSRLRNLALCMSDSPVHLK